MLLIDPNTGDIVKANISAHNFYGFTNNKLESLSIQDITAKRDFKDELWHYQSKLESIVEQ